MRGFLSACTSGAQVDPPDSFSFSLHQICLIDQSIFSACIEWVLTCHLWYDEAFFRRNLEVAYSVQL